MPGVVAFYDHRAIAGKNSCVIYDIDEPIFSEGKIMYAGQAVGVIVAESADLVPISLIPFYNNCFRKLDRFTSVFKLMSCYMEQSQ